MIALEEAAARRADVLPAAAGVKTGDIGTAGRSQQLLHLQVVARAGGARSLGVRLDLRNGLRDDPAEGPRHKVPLDQHHG